MKDLFFTMLPAALPKHKASLEFDAPPDMWKQPPEVFYQKSFKNFAVFTGKQLYWSLFLIKLQAESLQLC